MQRRPIKFWFLPFLLACAGNVPTTLPSAEIPQETQRSCTKGKCMTCYIYSTEVLCVKDGGSPLTASN